MSITVHGDGAFHNIADVFFGFFAISGFVLVKLLCLKDECSLVPDAEVL